MQGKLRKKRLACLQRMGVEGCCGVIQVLRLWHVSSGTAHGGKTSFSVPHKCRIKVTEQLIVDLSLVKRPLHAAGNKMADELVRVGNDTPNAILAVLHDDEHGTLADLNELFKVTLTIDGLMISPRPHLTASSPPLSLRSVAGSLEACPHCRGLWTYMSYGGQSNHAPVTGVHTSFDGCGGASKNYGTT